MGEHNTGVSEGKQQFVSALHIILHPFYNRYTLENDIMLLKLSKPAILNDFVKPVVLPPAVPPLAACAKSLDGATP